jgi:hypothetical protein
MMDEEDDDTSSFRLHRFDLSIKRSNSSPALPLLVNSAEYDNSKNFFFAFIYFFFLFLAMICNLMMWIFVIPNYADIVRHL